MQTQQAQTTDRKPFRFEVTNNVTRTTFEYVRDNPGQRNADICEAMESRGYKKTSVSSLLGQMVLAGLLRRDSERQYWAAKREYEPYSASKLTKVRAAKPKPVTPKPVKVAPPPVPAPAPQPEVKVVNSIDELIDTLTIAQARDLFARLRKMFA